MTNQNITKEQVETHPRRGHTCDEQLAERQDAEQLAREKEEEVIRREANEAEEALRSRPKSKVEQVTELLMEKLTERLALCGELMVLLRRAQEKARVMIRDVSVKIVCHFCRHRAVCASPHPRLQSP